jgi:hypothetical protein
MNKTKPIRKSVMSILTAARNNDWETVERLFKGCSASLLERDAEGKTLLHWAAIHGQAAFLGRHRALLGEGLVNTPDKEGYTPLYSAIKHRHADTVTALLDNGAMLDRLNINGDNPIHYAMRMSRPELALVLTQHLFKQLGLVQRHEANALLQALTTLYACHHRQTAEQFFEQAQKEHEAHEQEEQLANLSGAAAKEGMAQSKPLSQQMLKLRFQTHQLGKAQKQLLDLLGQLKPTDSLIPLVLLAISESWLQQNKPSAYEQAMKYAASAFMHYQKLVQETFTHNAPEAAAFYRRLIESQQNRIILIYRAAVLGPVDDPGNLGLTEYRTELFGHRERLKEILKRGVASSQELRALMQSNTHFFTVATERLWLQSLALSQKRLPCNYALLSLGSLSKEEMCPYSDLEFALVLEKDDRETRQFFQSIVRLMQLFVIACGETPITISCQVQFSATAAGYRFDEGGNTPLYDEFMGTPAFVADIQRRSGSGLTITRNALRSTSFISGNGDLYQIYQQQLKQALSSDSFFSSSIERRKVQAMEILESALPEFSPSSLTDRRHSRGVDRLNIKTDLYRLPSQLIESLSLYYGIEGNTTFEKLKGLEKKRVIALETALELTQLLETALKFRVLTQLHYGAEKESVAYQAGQRESELPHEASVYVLREEEREEILNAYQILLPLESALREFVSSKGENNLFKKSLVHSKAELTTNKEHGLRHHLEARSYEHLFSPEKALNSYRQALEKDPDNPEIHLYYMCYIQSLSEMWQRSQAAYEASAVSYAKQLAAELLLLRSTQSLPLSGFEPYYNALPLTWRPAFKATLNANDPFHRRLAEHLKRIDSYSKGDFESTHKEAKAYIVAKALPLLSAGQDEIKVEEVAANLSPAVQATDWRHLTTALKNQAHSPEERTFLLTHTFPFLSQLIEIDVEQIKAYEQEIKKSLIKVVNCFLTPIKVSERVRNY